MTDDTSARSITRWLYKSWSICRPTRCSPHIAANTRRSPNAGLMLAQRRRRWANIKTALGELSCFRDVSLTLFQRPPFSVQCWSFYSFAHSAVHYLGDFSWPLDLTLAAMCEDIWHTFFNPQNPIINSVPFRQTPSY